MDAQDFRSLQEAYLEVYQQLDEKEDSPYEKAVDASLDARYGYGRSIGDKRSFGRAANRATAAAVLRRLRKDRDEGRKTSTASLGDAAHKGWSHTATHSTDQTPEKKAKRKQLVDTPYSALPKDEQEKDDVAASAVKATYNRNRNQRESYDIYDIILSHLLDEGYAETPEAAEVMMVHMSEEWREEIIEELTGPRKEIALAKGTPLARRIALGREGQPLERKDRSGKVTMSTTQKGPTKRGGAGLRGRIKSDWYGHDESHGGT